MQVLSQSGFYQATQCFSENSDYDSDEDFAETNISKCLSFMGIPLGEGLSTDMKDTIDDEFCHMRRPEEEKVLIKLYSPQCTSKIQHPAPIFGTAEDRGSRTYMEDYHFSDTSSEYVALTIVCDGHGGASFAQFSCVKIVDLIKQKVLKHSEPVPTAIMDSVIEADLLLYQSQKTSNQGTTVTVFAVTSEGATIGWLGDSRAVLCDGSKAVALTKDHCRSDADEDARQSRVYGSDRIGLPCVTRAVGDFGGKSPNFEANKELAISNRAEIISFPITNTTRFVIIASDGLWDVVKNQEAVDILTAEMQRIPFLQGDVDNYETTPGNIYRTPEEYLKKVACKALLDIACERKSSDNVTVTVCLLQDISSYGPDLPTTMGDDCLKTPTEKYLHPKDPPHTTSL